MMSSEASSPEASSSEAISPEAEERWQSTVYEMYNH